jgi:hypothetical protein
MLTDDAMTSRDVDLLLNYLIPFGSLDLWHMVKTAEAVDIDMCTLSEILEEQANVWGVNLFDTERTTDVNALLNDYILQQARDNIDEVLNIDIVNDYDVYYFQNYLDCPLQYSNECKEALEIAIKENQASENDFNKYALIVLNEMHIELNNEEI